MSLKNGANYCVVSKNIRKKFIKVNNTMKFLNDFAKTSETRHQPDLLLLQEVLEKQRLKLC